MTNSLLRISLAKPSSIPVEKVNFIRIAPMTFTEFLLANGDAESVKCRKQIDNIESIPNAF